MMTISRSPLRYMGSKANLAKEIIARMPAHKIYIEPFGGGASVLLRKDRVYREVYNDLNDDITNFFQQLRDNTRGLVRAVQLTPFSRAELKRAWAYAGDDPLQRALVTYIKAWQAWGSGTGRDQSGWRFQVTSRRAAIRDWNNTKPLFEVAHRLKGVHIENDHAIKVLKRYDSPQSLFYCDPPYVLSERMKDAYRKGYKFEMSDDDHVELAETIKRLQGMVILSGYPSALYDQLYAGWQRVTFTGRATNLKRTTEVLWLSPNCNTDIPKQQLLFALESK